MHPECVASGEKPVTLVMIGGCRNADDQARIETLRLMANDLEISVSSDLEPIEVSSSPSLRKASNFW